MNMQPDLRVGGLREGKDRCIVEDKGRDSSQVRS